MNLLELCEYTEKNIKLIKIRMKNLNMYNEQVLEILLNTLIRGIIK